MNLPLPPLTAAAKRPAYAQEPSFEQTGCLCSCPEVGSRGACGAGPATAGVTICTRMAHSYNRLHTRVAAEAAFDFISDFTHASLWDPRTQSVRKLTAGPIGLGTVFMLRAQLGPLTLDFPYEIVEYKRPQVLVFAGHTHFFAYRERVTFTPEQGGTSITWDAQMELQSLLTLGNPILSLLYQRIGNDATDSIARVLEKDAA